MFPIFLLCIEIDPAPTKISGWVFDDLAITIQQHLCEALFAADRTKEAGESVLRLVERLVDGGINMTRSIKSWVSGEPVLYAIAATLMRSSY